MTGNRSAILLQRIKSLVVLAIQSPVVLFKPVAVLLIFWTARTAHPGTVASLNASARLFPHLDEPREAHLVAAGPSLWNIGQSLCHTLRGRVVSSTAGIDVKTSKVSYLALMVVTCPSSYMPRA